MIAKLSPHRGVAMIVVLGVIILVTMLGYVGLNMASKDRLASGDIMDIKSQNVALESAFHLAVSRLQSDPAAFKTILDNYLADGGNNVTPRSWLDLSKPIMAGVAADPGFLQIQTNDARAGQVKVEIKAVAFPGSSAANGQAIDESSFQKGYAPQVVVAFEATAKGRSGDEIKGVANYVVNGLGLTFSEIGSGPAASPMNALSLGGELKQGVNGVNFSPDITGNAYIGGDIIFNNNNSFRTRGTLKVNGNFFVMRNSLQFDSTTYIKGYLKFEDAGTVVTSNGDLGVGGYVSHKAGQFVANGNVWIGDYYHIQDMPGNNVALNKGFRAGPISGIQVVNVWAPAGMLKGRYFPANLPGLPGVAGKIAFVGTPLSADPTLADFGITADVASTELKDNLPEMIDTGALVKDKIVNWDDIYGPAGAGPNVNASNPDPGAAFNKVYQQLQKLGKLQNGFMLVRLTGNDHLKFPNGAGACPASCTPFEGKAVFLVDNKVDVNAGWPPSKDENAIQVILIRNALFPNANLNAFGFTSCGAHDFYGYVYWDNPQGAPIFNMSCAVTTWHGAFTVTPKDYKSATPTAASLMFNNTSNLKLEMDNAVFSKINGGLSGFIKLSGAGGVGGSKTVVSQPVLHQYSSVLQLERVSVFR